MIATLIEWVYRARLLTFTVSVAICLSVAFTAELELPEPLRAPVVTVTSVALSAVAITIAVAAFGPRWRNRADPPAVHPPVRGRWLAINSPSTKVPSHGLRLYGQSHAVDLVYWPADDQDGSTSREGTVTGGGWRRPQAFPSFGQPVLAMVDGTVVTASAWRRDHRGRTSTLARLYLQLEGFVRTIGGPGWVTGNHLIIRSDDGDYAVVAHLRKGSLRVAVGDRVRAGQRIADCGNSGNSTEPHVHAQLMDHPSLWFAEGVPLRFHSVQVDRPSDGELPVGIELPEATEETAFAGVPADGDLLLAPAEESAS